MLGTVIYVIFQIAIFAYCFHVLRNFRQIREQGAAQQDSPLRKIITLVLIPAGAYGYACLGGFPPKSDQLLFAAVATVVMYGAIAFRWRRQTRHAEAARSKQIEKRYLHRSSDGSAICGPDTRDELAALLRLGLMKQDALVADEGLPDRWKPVSEWPELGLDDATAQKPN